VQRSYDAAGIVPNAANTLTVGPLRVKLASTTTIYGVGKCGFTVSTLVMWGKLEARRAR
jgi:hypothetical protein